jgi:hypothetical protein
MRLHENGEPEAQTAKKEDWWAEYLYFVRRRVSLHSPTWNSVVRQIGKKLLLKDFSDKKEESNDGTSDTKTESRPRAG